MNPPNAHAVYSGQRPGTVPPGRCAYETSVSRLGTTWSYCEREASRRCTIQHGSTERVEDYCPRHFAAARRRTRYDVILSSSPIPKEA